MNILIDGSSEDNTLKITNDFRGKMAVVICEKDEGIYGAMNKEIDIATGDYLIFLNADDRLLQNRIIEQAVKLLSSTFL